MGVNIFLLQVFGNEDLSMKCDFRIHEQSGSYRLVFVKVSEDLNPGIHETRNKTTQQQFVVVFCFLLNKSETFMGRNPNITVQLIVLALFNAITARVFLVILNTKINFTKLKASRWETSI